MSWPEQKQELIEHLELAHDWRTEGAHGFRHPSAAVLQHFHRTAHAAGADHGHDD